MLRACKGGWLSDLKISGVDRPCRLEMPFLDLRFYKVGRSRLRDILKNH